MNAPVLFIGSNPNIRRDCVFPRWHPGRNPEFTLNGEEINSKGIYETLRDRLTANINEKGNPCALKIEGGAVSPYEVSYWRGIRMVMDEIAERFGIVSRSMKGKEHTERLMRSVLSSEVIFFGSKNETYSGNLERLCCFWDKFTVPLLRNCRAKVIVLVGGKANDTFVRAAKTKTGKQQGRLQVFTMPRNSCSVRILTPRLSAFVSFEPAFSPATT